MIKVAVFVRISSKNQDYERQKSDLLAYKQAMSYEIVEMIEEVISASKTSKDNRIAIDNLLSLAKAKKINNALVSEVSRLGRRTLNVLQVVEELTTYKVSVFTHSVGLDTLTPKGDRIPLASMIYLAC